MAPTPPRLKILSVGGNAVSAFLSWRLSATNACDVTLVWKSGFDTVAQYGITFKSSNKALGQERFKPRSVVRTPEEAAQTAKAPFDYVLLCVKALPDVYDLAAIIESVVSPQHTCILINTTHSLGVESYLESKFPTNVVLSLVCGAELTQANTSEFEHTGSTEFWVGAANANPGIPASIQSDMAEALAMTLNSGQVDCKVSTNIRQQQYERMIGPIAFQPASILFETSNHTELLDKTGVRGLVTGIIEELVTLAEAQGCSFPENFLEQTLETMTQPTEAPSLMYQDYTLRRPLEIETYLGSPIKLAQEVGLAVPRIQTLYALLHNLNIVNQKKPVQNQASPNPAPHPARMSSAGPGAVNGHMGGPPPGRGGMRPGSRQPSMNGGQMPGPMRRGPPPGPNGYPPRMANGHGPPGRGPPPPMTRRPSEENLDEFSHLMLYDNMPEGQGYGDYSEGGPTPSSSGDLALREREMALRQRELALREQEFHMRRGGPPGPHGPPPPRRNPHHPHAMYDDDDDDEGDYFVSHGPPPGPPVDADNLDMMSVTSRRTRKAPSAQQLRQNPEMMGMGGQRNSRNPFSRPKPQNRVSARMMADVPGLHDSIMSNPLMAYSSDRYGNVDRANLKAESRSNSLTAERLNEFQSNGYNGPFPQRRASQSPGNPLSPRPGPGPQRRSPPGEYTRSPPGEYANGRPSPPGMPAPMPRHPGNHVAPQRVEQQVGVSHLYPPKYRTQERSLTGSASASAGSGESARSARLESDPSAHSSSSSLGPRPPIGVR
ncbi:ketopantoate reductase-like protein 1 [Elsinoe australis]|uniref:Ketopantoate reductase-like protein 1 n=1 Tax=Elsinoe australis TaxID=40998 RepID=A0A4U7ASZ5_9PEZI|nr:ketopantoate reductase-like protein 1 [Elsinoe australis]